MNDVLLQQLRECSSDSLAQRAADEIERLRTNEGVCHCGLSMSQHSQSENHMAVEIPLPCPNELVVESLRDDRDKARLIANALLSHVQAKQKQFDDSQIDGFSVVIEWLIGLDPEEMEVFIESLGRRI